MGDDPNPALRKFPYEELAATGGALKYKTRTRYTTVPGTRISGTRYVVSPGVIFSGRSFGELGVGGEGTSRTSPQGVLTSFQAHWNGWNGILLDWLL